MKIKALFLSLILCIGCDNIGKGYKWQGDEFPGFSRNYGNIGYDYGWSAAYSPFDEGFIIVGQSSPKLFENSNLWAIKTDSRGMLEWEKKFGGDENDVGYDVISTTDGGFLLVGYTWSFGNSQQAYAIKIDFHGNVQWERTYGGSVWDVATSVIELKGGGYMIIGFSNSPGISSGNSDIYLIKISSSGDLIWQKGYGNQTYPNHEWGYDIVELIEGGFIAVGSRDRYNEGSTNGLIIRLDESGNLLWEKELLEDGQIAESIYSISITDEGAYYLCSSVNSEDSPDLFQPRIIKMDGFGNIDWRRTFNSVSKEYHQFRAIATYAGDLLITGSSSLQKGSAMKDDAFLIKIDGSGNLLWYRAYGSQDHDDWGWNVFETPKNNIVLVGSTKSFGSSLFDIYLVGTNSEGLSGTNSLGYSQ